MIGPIFGGASGLRFNSGLNIVFDGNSLVAGQGGAQNMPRVLAKTFPVATATNIAVDATSLGTGWWESSRGVRVRNLGINGQTWRQMNGLDGSSAADVDAVWVADKVNVLIAWEGTNAICNLGRTAAQAAQDAADYIAARQATHPWVVLIGTCLPRQRATQVDTDAKNSILDAYNALLRANYPAMGAKGLFDVRQAGSRFNLADYQAATFEAAAAEAGTLWASGESGEHVHLNSTGYIYVVDNCVIPALRRLPAR